MRSFLLVCLLAFMVAAASAFVAQPIGGALARCTRTTSSVVMGRGDKRTKKGKIKRGSFGNTRPHRAPEKIRLKKPASWAALNGGK
mmetsp:Transcript_20335/g.52495  ORF Transcript_20335/g.52495 Transcript_20335/m.52495 type:complete len:86 (+) Transcript_20335:51-308(+)